MSKLTILMALFSMLLLYNLLGYCQIYKCEDRNKKVHFSDRPCEKDFEDKSIDINPEVNVVSPGKVSTTAIDPEAMKGKAVVTLRNGDKVELTTKTMKSRKGLTFHQLNNLMLPNGVYSPYSKMRKIVVMPGATKDKTTIKITMIGGANSEVDFKRPITYVTGETGIGRFSKQLYEIREIVFY